MSLNREMGKSPMELPQLDSATERLITELTGICVSTKDQAALRRYVQSRLQALQLKRESQYCDRLRHSYQTPRQAEEWNRLMAQATNGETYFFRDPAQLKLIGDTLLPEVIARRRWAFRKGLINHLYLNLWSAGCSTGEEPYSLAMLLRDSLLDFEDWRIHLIATDINAQTIAQAKKGQYRDWSLRQIDPMYRVQYFQQVGRDWQIQPMLRSLVQWDVLNLNNANAIAHRIPWASMDLILCRNVFIYLQPVTISQILAQFHCALSEKGYLLVGHAELEGQDLSAFKIRHEPSSVVYQKTLI